MNKCFITKLPSSVDNNNLPVLGQLRINWLKQSNLTDNDQRFISLRTNDIITVKVFGAHFTDSTLTSNLGNTKTITNNDGIVSMYVSNDADAVLTIDNKYSLTSINFVNLEKHNLVRSVYFNIEDIKYCTNLTTLILSYTQVSGDIKAVSNLTNITYLRLGYTQVNGNISIISNLTNLIQFSINNTQISGDINAVSNLTNLNYLNLKNSQVNGDINAVSNLTNLRELYLSNNNISGNISAVSNLTKCFALSLSYTQVSGNVDSLTNLSKVTTFNEIKGLPLTGDMSKIPTNTYFISQISRPINTNFTWTSKGRQNATLLAMEGNIPFDTASMDNMLIDQATCTFKETESLQYTKTISVKGIRTSASDAAVAAIQNKGITITGVTKAS